MPRRCCFLTCGSGSEPVGPVELGEMYDNLRSVIATRPGTKVVSTVDGDVDGAYRDFLRCLRP